MGSSSKPLSTSLLNPVTELDDLDSTTSKLIAELLIQDIADINSRRKAKARADAPRSDEELAFALQHELWERTLRTVEDYIMAKSLDDAIDSDHRLLRTTLIEEQAAQDDRRAALALSNGNPLPPLSDAQRLVEDPAFSELAAPLPGEKASAPASGNKYPEVKERRYAPAVARPSLNGTLNESAKFNASGRFVKIDAPYASQRVKVECISCSDVIKAVTYLKGPCGHAYCGSCVTDLIQAVIRDESLYPPRCCSQPFLQQDIVRFVGSPTLLAAYNSKRVEFDIPATSRVFCPTPTCSTFLGSSRDCKDIKCRKCGITVCTTCRQTAHPGADCAENKALSELRKLAESEHWQTCPGCNAIVELQVGCYHITCRCRYQFCYLCARQWKSCRCLQWDEDRLIDTARQRVQQVNVGRAPVAPLVFQERVRQMADTLRDNHNCQRHSWRRQDGAGRCEECRYRLPMYLLVCRSCHLMACVRCARNRLA